jgi:hypothetical protein
LSQAVGELGELATSAIADGAAGAAASTAVDALPIGSERAAAAPTAAPATTAAARPAATSIANSEPVRLSADGALLPPPGSPTFLAGTPIHCLFHKKMVFIERATSPTVYPLSCGHVYIVSPALNRGEVR